MIDDRLSVFRFSSVAKLEKAEIKQNTKEQQKADGQLSVSNRYSTPRSHQLTQSARLNRKRHEVRDTWSKRHMPS